jgi:hypothetical protein
MAVMILGQVKGVSQMNLKTDKSWTPCNEWNVDIASSQLAQALDYSRALLTGAEFDDHRNDDMPLTKTLLADRFCAICMIIAEVQTMMHVLDAELTELKAKEVPF